jgi:hypothetical protein
VGVGVCSTAVGGGVMVGGGARGGGVGVAVGGPAGVAVGVGAVANSTAVGAAVDGCCRQAATNRRAKSRKGSDFLDMVNGVNPLLAARWRFQ